MWRTPFPLSATNVAKVIKVAESQNGEKKEVVQM